MTIREYYKEKLKDVNVPAPSSGDVPGNSGQVHSETIVGVAVIIAVCLVLIFIFKKFHLIKKINQEELNKCFPFLSTPPKISIAING